MIADPTLAAERGGPSEIARNNHPEFLVPRKSCQAPLGVENDPNSMNPITEKCGKLIANYPIESETIEIAKKTDARRHKPAGIFFSTLRKSSPPEPQAKDLPLPLLFFRRRIRFCLVILSAAKKPLLPLPFFLSFPSGNLLVCSEQAAKLPCPILSPFFWRQGGKPQT
jgi:hypothetical protein